MKLTLTIVLSVIFIGTTMFGLFGMNHSSDHSGSPCIISVIQGIDCASTQDILSMLNLHSGILNSFLAPTISGVVSIATIIFLAYFSFVFLRKVFYVPSFRLNNARFTDADQRSTSLFEKITSWLSFHENSPAFCRA
ncbi:MAG: hypothetical protein G01um10143_572 [Parcubacteria group bacterium Gr01-1014_3]|nr:MAG: hypothetical protein G01um10143_572 [Parcubacteria group bacterium Gr01-1014_3]